MNELFQRIARQIEPEEAYFVGGCVRDLLLGVPTNDVDLAVPGDTYALGRRLGREDGSHVFWLHQEEKAVRVLLPDSAREAAMQVDICPLRGTIEEDLRARDLTINAMAVRAGEVLRPGASVIDPFRGQADLAARVVRFVTPAAPEQDPLRTLRALRFRWKLDFVLEPATWERTRDCVPLLARVSVERIRDELFQLLAMAPAPAALAECLELGMGTWLLGADVRLPDGGGMPAPAARVRALQDVLHRAPPALDGLLGEQPTPPRTRREILLWAAALQPLVPTLDPNAATRRLALSNEERQLIVKGLAAAETAGDLARRWRAPGRAVARMLRAAGPAGPEAVLLAAARDGWSPAFSELLEEALQSHFWPPEPLVTGIEVMRITGFGPGPEIGRILQEVEDARADGLLRTREEAAEWLRERFRS